MKKITLILISTICFLFTSVSYGQYSETFSIPNKGLLSGTNTSGSSTSACPANTLAACANNDFTGVDWTINGDFRGFDSNDNLSTNGAGVLFFHGDIDNELCFESPILDISAVGGTVSISVLVNWFDHDGPDYVDVEYSLNGGAWIQISNQFGGGTHTVDFTTDSNTGSGTVTQGGMTGSTLSVRVCADTNTNSDGEMHTIDNMSVPEAGVTIVTLSTEDQIANTIKIYPNPVKNDLTVTMKNAGNYTFEMYNILGEKLFSKKGTQVLDTFSINVEEFHNGIYLLKVLKDDRLVKVEKIIVSK